MRCTTYTYILVIHHSEVLCYIKSGAARRNTECAVDEARLSPDFTDLSGHFSTSVDVLLFVMWPKKFLSHWDAGSSQVKSIIQMFYFCRKVGHMSEACTQLSQRRCCTATFRGRFNGIHNDVLDCSQSSTLVAWQHMVLLCWLGNDESCCCFGRNTKIHTTWFLRLKVDMSSAYGFPPAW